MRRGVCYNLFRFHGPPNNLFQDGQVRVTKLFCACCLSQQPQNQIVTNPGRTSDSRLQAWKLSVRTILQRFVVRGGCYNSMLEGLFGLVFAHFCSIFTHLGVMGPILEPGREKDAKKVPSRKKTHSLLETLFQHFVVFGESLF